MLLTLWIIIALIGIEFIYIAWMLLTLPPLPAPLKGTFDQQSRGEE